MISELKVGDRFIEYGYLQFVRDAFDKVTGMYKAHRISKDGETIHNAYYVGNEIVQKV